MTSAVKAEVTPAVPAVLLISPVLFDSRGHDFGDGRDGGYVALGASFIVRTYEGQNETELSEGSGALQPEATTNITTSSA